MEYNHGSNRGGGQAKDEGEENIQKRLECDMKNQESYHSKLEQRFQKIIERKSKFTQNRDPRNFMLPTLSQINSQVLSPRQSSKKILLNSPSDQSIDLLQFRRHATTKQKNSTLNFNLQDGRADAQPDGLLQVQLE
jgi:hypothetical protein